MMNLVFNAADLDDSLASAREDLERDPDYVAAGVATDIAEQVAWLMDKRDISRSALAERIGVNRAYITKILNAPPNMTLRTMVAIALALDAKAQVRLIPIDGLGEGWLTNKGEGAHFLWTTTDTDNVRQRAEDKPASKPDVSKVVAALATAAGEL